ncbi:heterokaryon incompatibility protein-domain-containing protein [Pestalotiopsis sp. NC0098]|nr:heterokaryon incompatibility protein-domain-containing protein [Pestalotiopsis sp. NC0098]
MHFRDVLQLHVPFAHCCTPYVSIKGRPQGSKAGMTGQRWIFSTHGEGITLSISLHPHYCPRGSLYTMSSSTSNSSIRSCLTCSEFDDEEVRTRSYYGRHNLLVAEVAHQECSVCDEFEVDESQLCHLCAHIRPAHLLTCSIVHDILKRTGNLEIELGTLAVLKERQNRCAFCRWCLHVVQADSQLCQYTIDDEEIIEIIRWPLIWAGKHASETFYNSGTYGDIPLLLFRSKTSRFSSSDKARCISIGHNKRLSWASGSDFATNLGLPKFKNFAAQSPVVAWDTIRRWKAVCEKEHSICRERGLHEQLPNKFRLIDVKSKSIAEDNVEPVSFFALSYVWGANPGQKNSELRTDNLEELKRDGSLRHLPRTITHAMDVCRILGQRYLWVDSLCIMQDDKVDKYGQIESMGAIYSRADLVIVAACGDSMQYGLPGVNNEFPREQYQILTNIFGFTMANMFHKFDEALESVWDERGWTYQEAVLAKRKLYFTEAELWFECSESLQRENVFSLPSSTANQRSYHLRAQKLSKAGSLVDIYDQYRQHLERYSRRILTFPSDVYNAFRGIQNSFYAESDVLFGLPESDFSRALLWHPSKLSRPQERQCNDRDVTLPSWSWASLIGGVATREIYGNENSQWRYSGSFYCSLCRWATWTVNEGPERVRRINSINDQMIWAQLDKIWSTQDSQRPPQFDFDGEPDCRQFLALAWIKGCIEADVPADLLGPETETSMSPKSLASRWPTIQDFWNEVQNRSHHKENIDEIPYLGVGHIATRTGCAALDVKVHEWGEYFFICKAHADGGERMGVMLDKSEYRLRSANLSDKAAEVDFIAMALGYIPWSYALYLDKKVLEENNFPVNQPEPIDQPGVIVMAVKWQGPIARRVALGWVTLQGWVDSKPEFRTVILS